MEKTFEDRRRAYILGRAIVGEALYAALKNAQITADSYRDPDEPIRQDAMAELADVVQEIVNDVLLDADAERGR